MNLFDALLRKLIRKGTLTVIDANGNRYRYGEASDVAPVTIRFMTPLPRGTRASIPRSNSVKHTWMAGCWSRRAIFPPSSSHTRWDDDEAAALRLRRPWRRNRRLEEWNWQRRD